MDTLPFLVGGAENVETGGDYDIDEVRIYSIEISADVETELWAYGVGTACP